MTEQSSQTIKDVHQAKTLGHTNVSNKSHIKKLDVDNVAAANRADFHTSTGFSELGAQSQLMAKMVELRSSFRFGTASRGVANATKAATQSETAAKQAVEKDRMTFIQGS